MPINRAPFNALVDDTGNGTSGSIWNKAAIQNVLLDPIDAYVEGWGTWTPTDASGAGLAFPGAIGQYCKQGRLVHLWAHVTYPGTANAAAAKIAGVPFFNGPMFLGFYVTYGGGYLLHFPANGNVIHVLNPNGTAVVNSTLSGLQLIFQGSYSLP